MKYKFLVMAVHLNSRGFAFVIFEGELAPLDWSAVEARGGTKGEKLLKRIEALFARCQPNVVVLEDMTRADNLRAERLRRLSEATMELARLHGLPIILFSRSEVRQQFAHLGTVTKDAIAASIAKHIPAFERFLPNARKPWQSEDARMGIFDAAALALTFYSRPGSVPTVS